MKQAVAVGLTALAAAAVIEAALVPGLIIGGGAVLASAYVPGLRRRLPSLFTSAVRQARGLASPAATPATTAAAASPKRNLPARFKVKRAVAKTITFRIIVTTLDFTSNIIVIGELGTAAGLSTFALVAGPLFYLAHEGAWNYLGPPGDTIRVGAKGQTRGFTVSRALAKTVTFRTIATIMDFSVTYVVVRDLATAAGLSAFGFIVGPFVYTATRSCGTVSSRKKRRPSRCSPRPRSCCLHPRDRFAGPGIALGARAA
ncbi:MAG: DUF2061 domain-containing protein [Xanthobacteraceae bacterium]|nr:DUF2061 domain-containing protein [Xanthobacteraceae bacterium]